MGFVDGSNFDADVTFGLLSHNQNLVANFASTSDTAFIKVFGNGDLTSNVGFSLGTSNVDRTHPLFMIGQLNDHSASSPDVVVYNHKLGINNINPRYAVDVNGIVAASSNVIVGCNLLVTGTTSLTGNVTTAHDVSIGGNLSVTGTITFSGGGGVNLGSNTSGDFSNLHVTGEATFDNGLTVNGTSMFGEDCHFASNIFVDGTVYASKVRLGSPFTTTTINGSLQTQLTQETQLSITQLNQVSINSMNCYNATLGTSLTRTNVLSDLNVGSNLLVHNDIKFGGHLYTLNPDGTSNLFSAGGGGGGYGSNIVATTVDVTNNINASTIHVTNTLTSSAVSTSNANVINTLTSSAVSTSNVNVINTLTSSNITTSNLNVINNMNVSELTTSDIVASTISVSDSIETPSLTSGDISVSTVTVSDSLISSLVTTDNTIVNGDIKFSGNLYVLEPNGTSNLYGVGDSQLNSQTDISLRDVNASNLNVSSSITTNVLNISGFEFSVTDGVLSIVRDGQILCTFGST